MPLEVTDHIDMVAKDRASGTLVLALTDANVTTDPEQRATLFAAKLQGYADYIASKGYAAFLPDAMPEAASIVVLSAEAVPAEFAQRFAAISPQGQPELAIPVRFCVMNDTENTAPAMDILAMSQPIDPNAVVEDEDEAQEEAVAAAPGTVGAPSLKSTFISWLLLIVGIVMLFGQVKEWRAYQELQQNGVTAPATIIQKSERTGRRSHSYRLEVEYRAPGAVSTYTHEFFVSASDYEKASEGQAVAIVYSKKDPRVAQLGNKVDMNKQPGIFGLICFAIGYLAVRGNMRQRAAAKAAS